MIAKNGTVEEAFRQLLTAFFAKYPNTNLQVETNRTLKRFLAQKISMRGKPGGWAGGIIYALANQYRRTCGVPGLLNEECEEFFNVSMGTIYRRAAKIRRLLGMREF